MGQIENTISEFVPETRLIRFVGRRVMCQKDFRLFLSTSEGNPQFSSFVSSLTTLISYATSNETLVDDLLMRAFAKLRPELYNERRQALTNIHTCTKVLRDIQNKHQDHMALQNAEKSKALMKLSDEDVHSIGLLMQKKMEVNYTLILSNMSLYQFLSDFLRIRKLLQDVTQAQRCQIKQVQYLLNVRRLSVSLFAH